MRLPKEIAILLILLAVMMLGVLWYVIDRRARNRANENARPAATAPARP